MGVLICSEIDSTILLYNVSLTSLLTNGDPRASLSASLEGKEVGRNGASVLCEVQEEGRDPEPQECHVEEQAPGSQGCMPEMRNSSIPHRQSLALQVQNGEPHGVALSLFFHLCLIPSFLSARWSHGASLSRLTMPLITALNSYWRQFASESRSHSGSSVALCPSPSGSLVLGSTCTPCQRPKPLRLRGWGSTSHCRSTQSHP
jgi:hypothetical protein